MEGSWKDVDGVLTYDPNIYKGAEPALHLTFDEGAEIAYFGAQVSICHIIRAGCFLNYSHEL